MAASLAKLCLAAALAGVTTSTATATNTANSTLDALANPPPLPFMPSVGIAAYRGCAEATADIHEDLAIEEVHGASCDKLNATRLVELAAGDCADTASDISRLIMTVECAVGLGESANELAHETCFLPKKGKQLEGCKTLLDMAIGSFTPEPIEELAPETPESMLDSFELILSVFGHCSSAMDASGDTPVAEQLKSEIDRFCSEETDAESMETMGLTDLDCRIAIAEPLVNMFKVACTFHCLHQVADPSAVTREGVLEHVGEFADQFGEIEKEVEEDGVNGLMHGGVAPLTKRLLRLHSLVGGEKYFGKPLGEALRKPLRKSASWSLASVALAAAASASALAALGLLAWRRHLAKGRPEDIELLRAQDTQE